ncbi:MAG: DEAD/DEAH box helicase, partial [Candidatus Omnitrophica bacterium]|nr:DEAD/DEAH box helicase [Candidatus Omnitrophota bacterium]
VLVPTEILAEQHATTLRAVLSNYATKIGLLTASVNVETRAKILEELQTGKLNILIGTHALLQESVNFRNLGLVIIDEQHKFGVRQRAKLLAHDPRPHLLIMSATPIPRTLGITLYGDLDISTIRELPKERKPIQTIQVPSSKKKQVIETIKKRILETGEQAYILFPIIEETEKLDLQAAKQEYERLKDNQFKSIPIGLIHGKLAKDERDQVMRDFQSCKLKLLVTTSVIEVGIDNPNATMMLIEHADRFGLSQLHQIRGRIGRGVKESVCYLIADPKTDEARQRLQIMTQTNDGFMIAEEDLKLRGPGEFFGSRQSGWVPFRLADMVRDSKVLIQAREEAKKILANDSMLVDSRHQLLRREIN